MTMKNVANWAAGAAFVFGVAGFHLYTEKLADRLRGGEPQAVLIVTRDLAPGETLTDEHLSQVDLPSHYLDPRRILAAERKKVLGVPVDTVLHAGEGLVWSDLRDGDEIGRAHV